MTPSRPSGGSPSVSVVVPCHRSGRTLPVLLDQLLTVLDALTPDHEVVLVVDGSPDDTWVAAESESRARDRVRALRLSRNFGQHNALLAGIRAATGEVVVTMDDDLQHRPEDVPRLVAALSEDVDVVYGVPTSPQNGPFRWVLSRAVRFSAVRVLGIAHAQDISAFRAFRTWLRAGFAGLDGPVVSVDLALSWTTTRTARVSVEPGERGAGPSGYELRTLARVVAHGALGFTTLPLRAVSVLGVATGVASLVGLLAVLATGGSGLHTVACLIGLATAAQLTATGVLGEYLTRVHRRTSGQPAYLIAPQERGPGGLAGPRAP